MAFAFVTVAPTFAQDGANQAAGVVQFCYSPLSFVPTLDPVALYALISALMAVGLWLVGRRRDGRSLLG